MIDLLAVVTLIEKLHEGSYTRNELMAHTGLSDKTVVRWLKVLLSRRLIRIESYQRAVRGGQHKALYEWNPEGLKDAPKLRKKSHAERSRDYRSRRAAREMINIISKKESYETNSTCESN